MTDELERALRIINYADAAMRDMRTPEKREEYAARVAGEILTDETAEKLYTELLTLRGGTLFRDEADLLQGIANSLGKPVKWRSSRLGYEWKVGRYEQ